MLIIYLDPPFGVPNEWELGCRVQQSLRVQTPPLYTLEVQSTKPSRMVFRMIHVYIYIYRIPYYLSMVASRLVFVGLFWGKLYLSVGAVQ